MACHLKMAVGMNVKISCLFLLIVILKKGVSNPQENSLNLPKVLLPYVSKGTKPTNFVLKAHKGCFKWSSLKPGVAIITPIKDSASNTSVLLEDDEEQCSQSALITVKQKSVERDSTVVLAEEEGTGFILRCDVVVDAIHSIEIETTTKVLLLGENPDVFEVYGKDEEGNLFTFLGSESFEWKILPAGHSEHMNPRNIVHFLWFTDSTYDTEREIYELEEKRTRGYSVLIEGINTGEAVVSAKLSHMEYKHVKASQVNVIVIDNVMLIPPVAYIMVDQNVTYKAQQIRSGKMQEIPLPSHQYSVSVMDKSIAYLGGDKTATVQGKHLGATKIELIDNNMGELSTIKKPTANLYVVEPSKIGFSIKPGKSWILQTGNIYEIYVHLYDEDNNEVYIDDSVYFKSELSRDYFEIIHHSKNGSYFHAKAKKKGKTILSATLKELKTIGGKTIPLKPVFGEQPIEIFDPLQVHPKVVMFPWDPTINSNTIHRYEVKITGGSGVYTTQSMNASFPITMVKKHVITVENQVGSGIIRIIDAKNNHHSTECKVIVLPPNDMAFNVSVVEVLVGKIHQLPMTVSAYLDEEKKNLLQFTQCNKMVFSVRFSEPNVFEASRKTAGIENEEGCTSIAVLSLKPGFTTVHATYQYADIVLKAFVVITAYNPLEIIDPAKIAVVTLGSKKLIVAKGGPLPWILDDRKYYELMSAEEDDWVKIENVNRPDETNLWTNNYHYFHVTCHHFGEQMLTINVGNHESAKNLHPASSTARTRFSCSPPASMRLVPVIDYPLINGVKNTIDTCRDEMKRIYVRNDRDDLRLDLQVFDSKGTMFDDVSSLEINWITDNNQVALIGSDKTLYEEIKDELNQNSRNQAYQFVRLSNKENKPLIVTAAALKYKTPFHEIDFRRISANVHLLLVSEPIIQPYHSNIFAHSTNKVKLEIKGGTKHFVVGANDYGVIRYVPPSTLSVIPKKEGKMFVTLHDSCLDSKEPAKAVVEMSDVYPLRLVVQDKVEVGSNITAVCQALNQNGEVIKVSDVANQMKLRLKSSVDILGINFMKDVQHGESQVSYTLTGKTPGFTSLTCLAMSLSGNEISSKAEEVQVFSAMELEPKYVLLIVGSTFKVHSIGGPKPHSVTVFSLDNNTVADVDYDGVVTAKNIGQTILTGKSKGVDSSTGKEIVFSKDTVIVEVIQLKGFKILTKSRQLITGAEIGIMAVGITDEGPFTFASSPPYLQFDWSTTNHDIVTVESFNYKNGISVSSDKDFRAVLKAHNSGSVSLKLKVKVLSNDHSQVNQYAQLEDAVVLQVYEKLKLIRPSNGKLLMPHDSVAKVLHNRDQSSHMTYELQETKCSGRGNPLIKITSSGEITSQTTSGVITVHLVVHEEFGFNQSVVFQVEVRPIASVSLVASTFALVKNSGRLALPLGSVGLVKVTTHDNMGRMFDVLNVGLKIRMSRSDVVHVTQNIENGTIILRAAAVGETILKVWEKDHPTINDYIRVRVAFGIQPHKLNIQVGEIACFSADSISESSNGHWSSSGNSISVDGNNGVIVGIASGKSILYFEDGDFTSYAEVSITTPSENPSLVDDEGFLFLTNSANEKNVFIQSQNDHGKPCSHLQINITSPYSCIASWGGIGNEVAFDDVFNIRSSLKNNRPACVFETKTISSALTKSLSIHDRNVLLTVAIRDETTKVLYKSSVYTLRFIPKLYVDCEKLKFTSKESGSQVIDIYGSTAQLSSIKITMDSDKVRVTKQELNDNTRHRYVVTVIDYPAVSDVSKLTFHSQLTNENHVIQIEIVGDPKSFACPKTSTDNILANSFSYIMGGASFWIIFYTIIFATIIACIILYHVITKNRQAPPLVYSSPYIVTPTSPPPYHYSPGAFNMSPQSYANTPTSIDRSTSNRPKQRTLYSVSQ